MNQYFDIAMRTSLYKYYKVNLNLENYPVIVNNTESFDLKYFTGDKEKHNSD